ncbi:MAG: ABC transporter substrate-binding protein [Eubacteriales bacterium]
MKKSIIFIILILAALTMASCSSQNNADNSDTQITSNISEISIPIEKIRTLNPIITKDEDAYYLDKLIFDSLISLDNNLNPVPELASSWTYENNGLTLVFTLNSNAKWHDGTPLTASDVEFTIETLSRAQYGNLSLYGKNVSNVKNVSTNGSDEVIINFKNGTNNAVENFDFPIISMRQFKNYNNVLKAQIDYIPIGTGPYKYASTKIANSILLTPNNNYYQEKKAKNSLIFKIVPDKLAAISLFEIGDLMITFSKAIDRETIFGDKDVNIYPYPSNEVEFVGFNFNNKFLKIKNLRQGIANAIDSQKIIDEAYFGNGVRNDNIYFPNYLGKNSSDALILNNLDKARQLFNEAGFINRDEDIYLEDPSGNELTINILVNGDDKSRISAAQLIKNNLDKLPIHSDIIIKDWNEYQYAVNSGNYDIFLGGFKVSETYDMRFALHSNSNNPIKYSNKKLDGYLDLMQSGLTKEDKLATFSNIKDILNQDLPYYCILYKTHAAITSKKFQGTVNPYFFHIYHECFDWSYNK